LIIIGSSKTTAFAISILHNLDPSLRECQVLILLPNREIVDQTIKIIGYLAEYMDQRIRMYGAVSIRYDLSFFQTEGIQIVAGTPGCVLTIIRRRGLDMRSISMCILDQFDEILSQTYEKLLKSVLKLLPQSTQYGIFTTKMTPKVFELSERLLRNDSIRIVQRVVDLNQFILPVKEEDEKSEIFFPLLTTLMMTNRPIIIYCNTQTKVEYLTEQMIANGIPSVLSMHDGMDAEERQAILTAFRSESSTSSSSSSSSSPCILITMDYRSSPQVHPSVRRVLIINYDLPTQYQNRSVRIYSHERLYYNRVKQTGICSGRIDVINFALSTEAKYIDWLEKYCEMQMREMPTDLKNLL
jgi:translation initiation factor 4A